MNRQQAAAFLGRSGALWAAWESGRCLIGEARWHAFLAATKAGRADAALSSTLAAGQRADLAKLLEQRRALDGLIRRTRAALAHSLRKPKCDLL